MKSYKEVYQMVNGLQKKASDQDFVPEAYKQGRRVAYYKNNLDDANTYSMPIYPSTIRSTEIKQLPEHRQAQASNAAAVVATPGTDNYYQLLKSLIEAGQTNWYNFNNPKTPKKMPKLDPSIKDKKIIEFFDRMAPAMVQNTRGTKSNIG